MKRIYLSILALIIGLSVGCKEKNLSTQEMEDLAYFLLADQIEGNGVKEDIYFVSIGTDLNIDFPPVSAGLLKRFKAISPKVRNASESIIIEGISHLKGTKKKGVIYYFYINERLSGERLSVETGFYGGGLYGGGKSYIIKKKDEGWEIIETAFWISQTNQERTRQWSQFLSRSTLQS